MTTRDDETALPSPVRLRLLPESVVDNDGVTRVRPSRADIEHELRATFEDVLQFTAAEPRDGDGTFLWFERALIPRVFALGRLLLVLFLCVREERVSAATPPRLDKDGKTYRRRPEQARNLNTFFGVVRYFRIYLRGPDGSGFHPLDALLGLTADRISMHLVSVATRLATRLSFAQVHATLGWFLCGAVPSTEMLERSILGLGRRTAEWFARAPPPERDGEVLVILFDGKGVPTATDEELARRRGPRRPNSYPDSPRHRGRERRLRYPSKPRRKKGDKSKHARMATMVVMYTLRASSDGAGRMLGPLNRWVYASFAPKRHAFEVARREAEKRGFSDESGKEVQIVTDGDEDLARYAKRYFPKALHTVDIMHVTEYLWKAGECLHREGSAELTEWVEVQKQRLYEGGERDIVEELRRRRDELAVRKDRGANRCARLSTVIGYLEKRLSQMNYKELLERDLEVGSGAVEGAVKNVIATRFDHGGSRWIRERAEPLLQLRCIECNGDWERFIQWVHDDMRQQAVDKGARPILQRATPSPLPRLAEAA